MPSFVLHPALSIPLGNRQVRVDVAFGGAFYAIVDSESVGVPITPARLPDQRKVGMDVKHAVEKAVKVEHPLEPQLHGIYGTIFTGPPSDESADLRNVTIFADADKAGLAGAMTLAQRLRDAGRPVRILRASAAKDPNALLLESAS